MVFDKCLSWNAKFVTARVKDNYFRKRTIWVPVWRSEIATVTAIFSPNYERNNGNHHWNTTSCFSNPLPAFTWLRTTESVGSVHNNLMEIIQYPMLLAAYFTNQMLWQYNGLQQNFRFGKIIYYQCHYLYCSKNKAI